jgi:elongation of very long chain fatty acids protein 6
LVVAQVFYPFSWENGFDSTPVGEWMQANPWVLWGSAAAYLLLVFGGQRAMRTVAPFRLKWALAGWNLTLALFSTAGTVRTLPHVLNILNHHGPRYMVRRQKSSCPRLASPAKTTLGFVR